MGAFAKTGPHPWAAGADLGTIAWGCGARCKSRVSVGVGVWGPGTLDSCPYPFFARSLKC